MKPQLQEYDMELVTVTLPKDQWEVVVKAIDIACNKPEPKPDVVEYAGASISNIRYNDKYPNLRLIFDGETGKLKDAEVLK